MIGDVGRGIFVREGIPEFMKNKAVPAADIITPNHFELDYLSGRASKTLQQAREAVKAVHDLGPRAILVTSLHTEETPEDSIDLLASDESGCFSLRTPKLPLAINGAGDAIAALFFAHYLRSGKIDEALSRAASGVFGVLVKTAEAGAREIQLVAAQDEIVKPSQLFEAEALDAMIETPSIFHIDRLELSFAPKPWAFAVERRAEIDAYFEALRREKPALWNGRVLLLHHQLVEHGVLRGEYLETDYASFAAWRHWGRPPAECAIVSARRQSSRPMARFCSASWARIRSMPGRSIFPCGTPDPDDIVDGKVDLDLSVRRELKEETGLDVAEFERRAGLDHGRRWSADRADQGVAFEQRVPMSCAGAYSRISRRERQPELADIRIVREATDFDPAMPRFVTAFLASRFAGG